MRRVLWNPSERRPRAGWRVAGHLALHFALLVGGMLAVGAVALALGDLASLDLDTIGALRGERYGWGLWLVEVAAGWMGVALAVRFFDRRRLSALGLSMSWRWAGELILGFALATATIGLLFSITWATGWLEVTGTFAGSTGGGAFLMSALLALPLAAADSSAEELIFRGYQIKNIAEGVHGKRVSRRAAVLVAWLVPSAFFGLAHAQGAHSTLLSVVTLMGVGALFGLAYVLTGQLSLSIGLHVGWNFSMGRIFGFPVSGGQPEESLFELDVSGPALWTGGEYGPEGGLFGWAAIVIAGLAVVGAAKRLRGSVKIDEALAEYVDPRPASGSPPTEQSRSG